ncbi:T9SS type A sorting domain-containing protein [Dyadobacter sp. CY347]|uniref:T9SS type A sorting domain-containing protein n=1 Tax=Dyadobacter sp. CY347 TaxID=2909336 RepID=UPI001F3AD19A|nr:T9SS type A sorting domain-containing protein [Dyadobacter sp. CY347]MCF2489891.1 T9SS type A sorting domain-containing protein [Dyadobacter sp. CY347]
MQRILLPILLVFLCLVKAYAQAPSILINGAEMKWQTCTDVPFQISVTISGRFDPGNEFKVQVRSAYTSKIITELPAKLIGNFLEITFKDAKLYESPVVQMRIVASAPKTEGFWLEQSFLVYSKGNVSLSQAAFSDSINIYEDYKIRVSGYSTSGGWATLNDSSKIQIPSVGTFTMLQQLVISQEGPLTIVHAHNECGAMTTSGTVRPVVNKTSIKTLSVDPQMTCEGAEVKIGFSVAGAALPAQTRYRIRFSDINSNDAKPNSVDVAAQLKDGYLVARFPENFNIPYSQEFMAQVVTDNAVASLSNRFVVRAKPTAKFTSQSETIDLGASRYINLNVTGLPPLKVELSDGSTSVSEQGQVSITVRPDKTTSYTIKSMSSACSNEASLSKSVLEIKVNPGIRFANETDRQVFCGGSKASVKFISNAALNDATQFWISAQNLYNSTDKFLISATRSGDQLTFDVPQRELGYSGFGYQIVTASPSLASSLNQLIEIQTMPGMEFRNYNIYDYQIPSNVQFYYVLRGGPQYVLETMEGEKFTMDSNGEYGYGFYLKQNREFRFKSISNGCFKNENLPSKTFRVLGSGNKVAISLEPVKKQICANDSIEVTFQKFGNFNAENEFQIQGMADCCDYKTLATVSGPGKYKVKLPADRFLSVANIRIASTSPILFSDPQSFSIQLLPEQIRLSVEGTPENPLQSYPYQNYLDIGVYTEKGIPTRIAYTQNGEEKVFENRNDQTPYIPFTLVPGKVNEFVMKSASNLCGTVPVDLKAYIYSIPYRIMIQPTGYEGIYCIGGPITIPFGVVDPMSKPATFSLQIAAEGSTDFTTIGTAETGNMIFGKIPENAKTGNNRMRIISSDGVATNEQTIRIGTKPTATLGSGVESEPIVSDPWQNTSVKVALTGGPHWTVVYEDNSRFTYFYPEETRNLNPIRGGKFFIKSVSNVCGYGTTSGSVAVKVNPGLQVNSNAFNACEGGTFPITYTVLGDADLSDDYVRFELTNYATGTVIVLDSTKALSGTQLVKMPDIVSTERFEIRVTIRKYNLRSSLNAGFARKPAAVLSGNTTINSGETTYILAQTIKDTNDGTDITLSDGTKSRIYGQTGDYSYIEVSPKQTTTYTIATIKNGCGTGVASGSATVVVNPETGKSVAVTNIHTDLGAGTCAGSEINVFYAAKGSLSAGNRMTVQISDSTGQNFTNMQTTGTSSPLKAVIPLSTPDGRRYRIRVMASDAGVSSSAFRETYTITQKSAARFSTASVAFDGVTAPRVQVLLQGGAPWTFRYGTDFANYLVTTSNPSYEIQLLNASPNQIYKLFGVSNACGAGDIGIPETVRIEVITGTNEPAFKESIRIYPNPTQDVITLEFHQPARRNIELLNIAGHSVEKVVSSMQEEHLNISKLPAGIYVIEVSEGAKKASYRIVKQ